MAAIGFVLSQEQFTVQQLLEFGERAEQAGFDMVWTSDHFHPWQDNQGHAGQAWITLGALGQRTTRVPMGTGVTCPSYRYNPAIIAQSFATLGNLYPGRIFLGVGAGEALNEKPASGHWGEYEERRDRLVEAVTLIRELWKGNWVTHRGRYFQVEQARLYDLPHVPVPIYMAASGDESMYVAGQYGDGLITDGESLQDQEEMKAFEQGLKASGRSRGDVPIITELFGYIGTEEEAKPVAEKWRFLPQAWTRFVDDPDPRSIEKGAKQNVKIEDVLKMWVVSTDPQDHIKKMQELQQAGATHIFVHAGNEDQHSAIQFYEREVLPNIQHEPMTVGA